MNVSVARIAGHYEVAKWDGSTMIGEIEWAWTSKEVARIVEEMLSEPAVCPGCGTTLNADGECPRAIELDAAIATEADEDTEEIAVIVIAPTVTVETFTLTGRGLIWDTKKWRDETGSSVDEAKAAVQAIYSQRGMNIYGKEV